MKKINLNELFSLTYTEGIALKINGEPINNCLIVVGAPDGTIYPVIHSEGTVPQFLASIAILGIEAAKAIWRTEKEHTTLTPQQNSLIGAFYGISMALGQNLAISLEPISPDP